MDSLLQSVRAAVAVVSGISGVLLGSSVALNLVNIVGRYFFSVSIPWAEEVMLFLMVGCVFTGCCAVAWEGRHIRMDVVVSMLPTRPRAALALLSNLVFIAAAFAVSAFAWPVVAQLASYDERSQAANLPLAIPQGMIPLGYTTMALLVAARLLLKRRAP